MVKSFTTHVSFKNYQCNRVGAYSTLTETKVMSKPIHQIYFHNNAVHDNMTMEPDFPTHHMVIKSDSGRRMNDSSTADDEMTKFISYLIVCRTKYYLLVKKN